MASVDEAPLGYLPPMRFDPFNNRSLMRKGGAGGSATLTWKTGYPYDLMEDMPPLGARSTTSARGGAVKYIERSYPGQFPDIDRYYAFVAKDEEISLWGYVKQSAEWNWKVVIPFDGKEVEHSMFNAANSLYLGSVIKDNGKESSLFGYSDSGKRNYKVIADDEKASLEAWEVEGSEPKYIIASTKDWPENVAGNTKNKRLVLASESYKSTKPQTVKLRELELDLPKGCPFDLTFAVNEDSNSAVGAVKHTGCLTVDGEKVGNGVYERYAAANADAQKTGFTTYFGLAEEGYLDCSTKGQGETFVYGYADQGDSNFRLRALGADQSLELWSTANDTILKGENVTTQTVFYGRFSGDYQFTLKADATQSNLAIFDAGNRSYGDVKVNVTESSYYGYADDGTASHRIRSMAFKSEVELWKDDGSGYGLLRVEPFRASLWLNSDNEVYNVRIAADTGDDSSYCRVYGQSNNVFGSLHTEEGKASAWGYSDNQQNLFTNEASSTAVFWRGEMSGVYNTSDVTPSEVGNWGYVSNGANQYTLGAKSSEVFVRAQLSNTYNSMDAKPSEAGNWGYISSGSNQYTLGAQSSEVFVRAQLSQSFVGISTKSATADIWGYTDSTVQWKCEASSSQSKCQTFNSSGWAQISAISSKVSFDASLNNDFSYLTQNTLRVEYGNGDHSTLNPGSLYVNYNGGAYSRLFGGGVYVNDGSNWVNIEPPSGKDAYFQQVDVCVNGETKKAYVLMTETFD